MMRPILFISAFETRKFFYSPIAWTVMVIFIVQLSYFFTTGIEGLVENQFLSSEGYRRNYSMRVFLSSGRGGVFDVIQNSLFLYIPLLSMALMSRELDSGSFKLLLSSSIRPSYLVIGKFLSMIFLALVFALIVVCFGLGAGFLIPDFQYQIIIPGFIAVLLLCATYSAIGLFISSLTSYQVVAAILTFGVLLFLNAIGNIGQDIPVLNEILFWLSLAGRSEQLTAGLFESSAAFYYLILTATFLGFTVIHLKHIQTKMSISARLGSYFLIVFLAIVLGYIASRPHLKFFYDFTPNKTETISKESQMVASKFKDVPIKLKSYVNILSRNAYRSGLPHQQNADYRRFDRWTRFIPHLEFEYIYFYDSIPGDVSIYTEHPGLSKEEIAKKYAKSYNIGLDDLLSPAEIREIIDLSTENNEYVRQFEANGKTAWLRMYYDLSHYPNDDNIVASLYSLLVNPPLVGVLQGHGERSLSKKEDDYSRTLSARGDHRHSARNLGYRFKEVYLEDSSSLNDIDALLIADPVTKFSEEEIERLRKYIDGGKNLILLMEPGSPDILQPICAVLSINLIDGSLVDTSHDYTNSLIFTYTTDNMLLLSRDDGFRRYTGKYDLIPVILSTVAAFSTPENHDFNVLNILKTNDKTFLGDSIQTGFEIGVALQRQVTEEIEQRILVLGDADFLSNSEQGRRINQPTANYASLIMPLFRYMSYDKFPLARINNYPETFDNKVLLNTYQVGILKLILLIVFPSMIIGLNAIYLKLRKHD